MEHDDYCHDYQSITVTSCKHDAPVGDFQGIAARLPSPIALGFHRIVWASNEVRPDDWDGPIYYLMPKINQFTSEDSSTLKCIMTNWTLILTGNIPEYESYFGWLSVYDLVLPKTNFNWNSLRQVITTRIRRMREGNVFSLSTREGREGEW